MTIHGNEIMFDTQFQRLLWKEYRQQRALWLAIAIATPALQWFIFWLQWLLNDYRPPRDAELVAVAAIGFACVAVYLLGCAATMFSVEHEAGTFDFQRVLPTRSLRVFWAKVFFAAVSGFALAVLLWTLTRALFQDIPQGIWFGINGLLYWSELFAWSVLTSMLIRHPLWSVVLAITAQSIVMQVVITELFGVTFFDAFHSTAFDLPVFRLSVLIVLGLVNVYVGRLWIADRVRLPKRRSATVQVVGRVFSAETLLPAYLGQSQIGWRRMLWLSWRDARWIIGGIAAGYVIILLRRTHHDQWAYLPWITLPGSFWLGLFAFGAEQMGSRYRFMAERGCVPRVAWLCRHVVFLPMVLLMCAGTAFLQQHSMRMLGWNEVGANGSPSASDLQLMKSVAGLLPFVCYGAAQFGGMLCRRVALGIAVSLMLCIAGVTWLVLMGTWLVPWWSIVGWPIIAMFVTWLRANDWVEERAGRAVRRRLMVGIGVPSVMLLAACATYRVLQFPTVVLPPEWDAVPQVLARLSPSEKESLTIYRQALNDLEAKEFAFEPLEQRRVRIKQEHADWNDAQIFTELQKQVRDDWLKQNTDVAALLRAVHAKAPVPLALLEAERPANPQHSWPERLGALSSLMQQFAGERLNNGQLDSSWQDVEVVFELLRRKFLRATLPQKLFQIDPTEQEETGLLDFVAIWGRHENQTQQRIVAAIRRLEEFVEQTESVRYAVHHQFLNAEEMLKFDERWKAYQQLNRGNVATPDDQATFFRLAWNGMPWERWRSHRAVRWQTSLALTRAELLDSYAQLNLPLPVIQQTNFENQSSRPVVRLASSEQQAKLKSLGSTAPHSAEAAILNATILPRNMHFGVQGVAEWRFISRLEWYRATMLLLALSDFHRQHARYPDSLDELVPTYFQQLPRNPHPDASFVYFPLGVNEDGKFGRRLHQVGKGVPLLVSWKLPDLAPLKSHAGTSAAIDTNGKIVELKFLLRNSNVWPVESPPSTE